MFADDTAVISQNKRFSVVISNLQHYVSSLELWLNDWKIKVNASKSACLMFTRRSRLPVGLTPVTIFGQPVPWDLSKRFFDKLPSVPNELITNQPAYDPAVPSSQKRPRALLEHEFINFPQAKRLRVQI
ncbi:hypothetical protein TNCV_1524861 [Trichonephila clavipes]|nr:hypothetical protein TNCV_1524861 [Trichonephila clavipes]